MAGRKSEGSARGAAPSFGLKRVYDPPSSEDGTRILVDRLWPRGLSRDKAQIDLWLRDIAPSDALRRRFHGKPEAWEAFQAAYAAELADEPHRRAVATLREYAAKAHVTLLYAARDRSHNNAAALAHWLAEQGRRGQHSKARPAAKPPRHPRSRA
jgi:uncharacterized protein YeaO (DUF488 family)